MTESAFATIRHRTKRSKGCLNRDGMLHMMFKLGQCAEENWRKLRGFDYLAKVITGVTFKDGIETKQDSQIAARSPHDQKPSNTRFHNNSIHAAALLVELPQLGTLKEKQVASLAGLAPMTRQSGRWTGKAFIQGDRKRLRDALYMPAVVVARHNPDMKWFYDRLVNSGKPAKVAFIAIMRKLILLENLLIKQNRIWTNWRLIKTDTIQFSLTKSPYWGSKALTSAT